MDAQKPKALAGEAVRELGKVRFPLVPEREKEERGWSLVVMLIEDQNAAFWVGLNNTDRSFRWQTGTSLQLGQKRTDCGVTQSSPSFLDQLQLVRTRYCSGTFQGEVSQAEARGGNFPFSRSKWRAILL